MAYPEQLPEYDRPPVSEVVLSVAFSPLGGWTAPYGGLYWSLIRKEYPKTEVQPPFPTQIEQLGGPFLAVPAIRFEVVNPDVRFWFITDPANYVVQVQRDRFTFNWRKVRGDERYPRYEKIIRPRFVDEWKRFKQFISAERLGEFDIQQCELTYVNDIIKGDGWNDFPESLALFARWSGKGSTGFLPPPETYNVSGAVALPDQRGRLHFAAQHVLRQLDGKQAVQLRLMARGKPNTASDGDMMAWMDFARGWIVRGFTDLISKKAQDIWGLKQ